MLSQPSLNVDGATVTPLHYTYIGDEIGAFGPHGDARTNPYAELTPKWFLHQSLYIVTDRGYFAYNNGAPTNVYHSTSGGQGSWWNTDLLSAEVVGIRPDLTETTDPYEKVIGFKVKLKPTVDLQILSSYLNDTNGNKYYDSFVDYEGYEDAVRNIATKVTNTLTTGTGENQEAEVSQTYGKDNVIDKTSNVRTDDQGNVYIDYDVFMNLEQANVRDKVYVTDKRSTTMGDGVGELDTSSVWSAVCAAPNVNSNVGPHFITSWFGLDSHDDQTGTATFYYNNLAGWTGNTAKYGYLRIHYSVKVSDDAWWEVSSHYQKTYTNEVTSPLGLKATTSTTVTRETDALQKTGYQILDKHGNITDEIGYDVTINYQGLDLLPPTYDDDGNMVDDGNTLELTDTVNRSAAEFKSESIALYKYDENAEGHRGAPVTSGWSYTYDSTSSKLTVKLPDEQGYVLTYVYDVSNVPASIKSIENSARLAGIYSTHNEQHYELAGGGGTADERILTFEKVDKDNYLIHLKDATFKLEKYQNGTWTKIGDYTTDASGYIKFDVIEMQMGVNTLYRLTETVVPDGYKDVDESGNPVTYYFVIKDENATDEETLAAVGYGGDHFPETATYGLFNFAGGSKFIENEKLQNGSLKITKQVTDGGQSTTGTRADGTYKFTIKDASGTEIADSPVSITITNGKANTVEVKNLPAGDYTIAEQANTNGTTLTRVTGGKGVHNNVVTVTVTAGKSGDDVTATGIGVFVNDYSAKEPTSEKKIKDTNDSTGESSDWQDSADYDIGDDVPYRLKATLADNVTSYHKYHVTFVDEMEQSLTFKQISKVTIKKAGATAETELTAGTGNGQYSFTKVDNQNFTLTVNWAGSGADGKIADAGLNEAEVYVYFDATLNDKAVFGKPGNVNKSMLKYSNNPTDDQDGTPSEDETPWDFVIAFTYKLAVGKVDQAGEALEGAAFKLEKVLADGTKKEIASDVSGTTFTFKGLDDGDYVLTETTTPEGYSPIDPITFTVTAEHSITWDDESARNDVLTSLTGDEATGVLTLTPTNDLSALEGPVSNDKKATANIEATKSFENWGKANSFTFTLTALNGAPMPASAGEATTLERLVTANSTTANFGTISYSAEGTYNYTITETDDHVAGVTYDTKPHNVTVTVERNDTNTLEAHTSYEGSESLIITNTFKPVEVEFEVTKELVGRDWTEDDSFEFMLTPVIPTNAPMPQNNKATATLSSNKVATFDPIAFDLSSDLPVDGKGNAHCWYHIAEIPPEGAVDNHDGTYTLDGITYDTNWQNAYVTISKNSDNSLAAKVDYIKGGTQTTSDSLTVTNTYDAKGEANVFATKTLDIVGETTKKLEAGDFSFKLTGPNLVKDGAPVASLVEKNDANGKVAFDAIEYTLDDLNLNDAGTATVATEFQYSIIEIVPDNAVLEREGDEVVTYAEATDEEKATGVFMLDGVYYSEQRQDLTITVSDNGDGTLGIKYDDSDTFAGFDFENEYFEATAHVEFDKLFYGEGGEFTFRMTPADENGTPAADTTLADMDADKLVYSDLQHLEWAATVESGIQTPIVSRNVTFEKAGTYYYLISEIDSNDAIDNDEATLLATIVVGEDAKATVTYKISKYEGAPFEDIDAEDAVFFNNGLVTMGFRSASMRKYNNRDMIAVYQPEIRKVLENGTLKKDEFSFSIYAGDSATGTPLETVTNDELGLVRFSVIKYEHAKSDNDNSKHEQTYTYTIVENAGNDATIVYSTEQIKLTVTVTENDGDLIATGAYTMDGKPVDVPTITNHYDTVKIHAVKYSREDLENGIKTPLVGAHYGMWAVNPDGNDVYLGAQTSDEGGNLYYDIPTVEGIVYYFKEEYEPPAGHLVDPYPTDYFTLVIGEGKFSLKYFASYDDALDYIASANNG